MDVPPYETKGNGDTVTGMIPRFMPMFERLERQNQQITPVATSRPNGSRESRDLDSSPQDDAHQQDDESRANQPQFFTGHREHKVGLLIRNECTLSLIAIEQSLASSPPPPIAMRACAVL